MSSAHRSKVVEALNFDNLLEFCKQQHTTSHQARSFKKVYLTPLAKKLQKG